MLETSRETRRDIRIAEGDSYNANHLGYLSKTTRDIHQGDLARNGEDVRETKQTPILSGNDVIWKNMFARNLISYFNL